MLLQDGSYVELVIHTFSSSIANQMLYKYFFDIPNFLDLYLVVEPGRTIWKNYYTLPSWSVKVIHFQQFLLEFQIKAL